MKTLLDGFEKITVEGDFSHALNYPGIKCTWSKGPDRSPYS